jgi:hypothetical protein
MSKLKNCALISRHPLSAEQRASLKEYKIIQINPRGRLWSSADAIALSQTACGGWPDLYVVVMPLMMLKSFVEQVNGLVPILRQTPDFTGHWVRVTGIHIVTEQWVPKGRQP